jgi:hypothetical protein
MQCVHRGCQVTLAFEALMAHMPQCPHREPAPPDLVINFVPPVVVVPPPPPQQPLPQRRFPNAHPASQAATDRRFRDLGPELKPDAPADHFFCHERIDPTLTRHSAADMEVVRELFVRMSYRDRKMRGKTPSIAASHGDDKEVRLAMRETRFTRTDPRTSVENVFYGLCQLAKTREMTFSAWCSYFILGCAPVIFVRNKGGSTVGSSDMKTDVDDLNKDIKGHLRAMMREHDAFPQLSSEADFGKFLLDPQVTSDHQHFEFTDEGFPAGRAQVLIACMNANQVDNLMRPANGRRASTQCMPTYNMLFGGGVYPGKCERPFEAIDAVTRANIARMRMTMICDEDDLNRTTLECKKGAIEKKNWNAPRELRDHLDGLQGASLPPQPPSPPGTETELTETDDDDDYGGSGTGAKEVDEDASDHAAFHRACDKKGLRDFIYGCTSTSATPMAMMMHLGARELNIVTLQPPANYIGFPTAAATRRGYHVNSIEVCTLEERNDTKAATKSALYRKYFDPASLWNPRSGVWNLETDSPPPPFTITKAGTVRLSKSDERDLEPARLDKEQVDDAHQRQQNKNGGKAWEADGDNISTMCKHMMDDKASPYRRALINTNFTAQDQGKLTLAGKLMKEYGDSGLIVLEYSHKYVRVHYSTRAHTMTAMTDALKAKGSHLDGEATKLWDSREGGGKGKGKGKGSGKGVGAGDDDDGAGGGGGVAGGGGGGGGGEEAAAADDGTEPSAVWHLREKFKLANINHLYSAIERYRQTNPGILLRTVCLSGAIGGRGVRYKSHKHEGVLTDQYYAFDVKEDLQVTTHGETQVQIIGRLCGLFCETLPGRASLETVDDMAAAPAVRLWIPDTCWSIVETNMEALDQVVEIMRQARLGEQFQDTIARVCASDLGQYREARSLFYHAIGEKRSGAQLYCRSTRPSISLHATKRIQAAGAEMLQGHGEGSNGFNLRFADPGLKAERLLADGAARAAKAQRQEQARWAVLRQAFPQLHAAGGAGGAPASPVAVMEQIQQEILVYVHREVASPEVADSNGVIVQDIQDGIRSESGVDIPLLQLGRALSSLVAAGELVAVVNSSPREGAAGGSSAGGVSGAADYTTFVLPPPVAVARAAPVPRRERVRSSRSRDSDDDDDDDDDGGGEGFAGAAGGAGAVSERDVAQYYSSNSKRRKTDPRAGDRIEVQDCKGWVKGQVIAYDGASGLVDVSWDNGETNNFPLLEFTWNPLPEVL